MGKHKMSVHLVASCAVKYVFSLTFQLVKCQRVKNLYGTELVVCVCVFFLLHSGSVPSLHRVRSVNFKEFLFSTGYVVLLLLALEFDFLILYYSEWLLAKPCATAKPTHSY